MRVIAGEARGFLLKSARGRSVRPTADRVREALFSILADRVEGSRFLDLYAGTGAVGIEALSRGASEAMFVERSRAALRAIHSNLRRCGFENRARVIASPVLQALGRGELEGHYGVIYVDPPYESTEAPLVLVLLGGEQENRVSGGLVVLEHRRAACPPDGAGRLRLARTALYGDTALSFYQ